MNISVDLKFMPVQKVTQVHGSGSVKVIRKGLRMSSETDKVD